MPKPYRPFQEIERREYHAEKELGIEDLIGSDIKTAFPGATRKTNLSLVFDEDTNQLCLVVTAKDQVFKICSEPSNRILQVINNIVNVELGSVVDIVMTANTTLPPPPTPPIDGFKTVYRVKSVGGDFQLTLATGVAGGFRFGTDISTFTPVENGKIDYFGAMYKESDNRWDIIAYERGYA